MRLRRHLARSFEADVALPVVLAATNEGTLAVIPLDALKRHALDLQKRGADMSRMPERKNRQQLSGSSEPARDVIVNRGTIGLLTIGAQAVGALALGALAIGALVIDRLAIKRLAVENARRVRWKSTN